MAGKGKMVITIDYDLDPKNYPKSCKSTHERLMYDFNQVAQDLNYLKDEKFKATIELDGKIEE